MALLASPPILTFIVFRAARALGFSFSPLQPIVAAHVVYGLAAALSAAALCLFARRRGLIREIFDFRTLGGWDWLIAIAGLLAGLYVLFPLSQWLARLLLGAQMTGAAYDWHRPFALPLMGLSAVAIAPFCEEVLFRGLGVAYLKSRRLPAPAIWLVVTLAFTAIHLPNFGLAGGIFMLLWGGMVTAIRQWRQSLSPGLLLHVVNNAVAYLVFPLLSQSQ